VGERKQALEKKALEGILCHNQSPNIFNQIRDSLQKIIEEGYLLSFRGMLKGGSIWSQMWALGSSSSFHNFLIGLVE